MSYYIDLSKDELFEILFANPVSFENGNWTEIILDKGISFSELLQKII